MDYEKEIKEKLGLKTVAEFARHLGAPVRTLYAYIKNRRAPLPWQWKAYVDAVKYRALAVDGWKCKQCGSVIEVGDSDGRKPKKCEGCGGKYFNPVRVVHEPNA